MKPPLIIKAFLEPDLCSKLVAAISNWPKLSDREEPNRHGCNLEELPLATKALAFPILKKAADAILSHFSDPGHHLDHAVLERCRIGGYVIPHADNCRPLMNGWQPNHTGWRTYSMSLCLTDCLGGELRFPKLGKDVFARCERGTLIGFPAGHEYLHFVTPVQAGIRWVMVAWLTRSTLYNLEKRLEIPDATHSA